MDSKPSRWIGLLLGFSLSCPALAQFVSDRPAEVPAGAQGEYQLRFSLLSGGGPFNDGDTVNLEIGGGGALCIGSVTLDDPVIRDSSAALAIWVDSQARVEFAAPSFSNPDNFAVNVTSLNGGTVYGRLIGQRSGTQSDCGESSGPEDPLENELSAAEKEILELAERLYPELFQDGGALARAEGFLYRFYQGSGTYIGFREGQAYVLGGPFGTSPVSRGSVADTLGFLREIEEERDAVAGDYDLEVSGTRAVSLGNTSTPPQRFSPLHFSNVAAPDPDSQDAVEQAIRRTLSRVDEISNLQIELLEQSAQGFILRLSFDAVQGGIDTHYLAEYRYTL